MKLKSNAASSELTSPFYKINKDFCREFENYIASKNGSVKGNYNAWSYFIQAKILAPLPWKLKYKKATYTSTGNLILSAKKQNLLTLVEWSTQMAGSFNSEFAITKKGNFEFIKKLFNDSRPFNGLKQYVIRGTENKAALLDRLYPILEHLFRSGEVYSVILKDDILTISLRTEAHHFETFENLLKI